MRKVFFLSMSDSVYIARNKALPVVNKRTHSYNNPNKKFYYNEYIGMGSWIRK